MDEDPNDNEMLAEMFADVAFDVLSRIGSDPEARYQFFREFIQLAKRTVAGDSRSVQ